MNIRRLQCLFSARSCSTSSLETCGTQGRATPKRLKFGVKPLISIVLIIATLFSFAVPSFAASSVTYRLADFEIFTDSDIPTRFDTLTIDGRIYTCLFYNSANDVRVTAFRKISDQLKIGTSYTLTFTASRYYKPYSPYFTLFLSDDPVKVDNAVELCSFDLTDKSSSGFYDYSIQFQYPEKFNGKQCYIVALAVCPKGDTGLYVSDFVFTDNNAAEEEKIDSILDWLSSVYHGIVGGEDSRGVQHEGLVQGIKNGLNYIKDAIVYRIEALKTAITDKIESIKVSIEAKIEAIGEDIKNFFIPRDGYFEERFEIAKTWAAEHFGIVYTAGDLGITVIRQFTTLTPPEDPVLNVPAWQMRSPIDGELITLVEESQIHFNDYIKEGTPLYSFYRFYKVFITVAIIFMVVNYARNKFDYVFGKDGEGVS